jgi:iron-sulfur cluster assembly protein
MPSQSTTSTHAESFDKKVASASPAAGPSPSSSSKAAVALSPKAIEMAKKQLQKRGTPDAAIRLGLRGGGCSGFTYVIEFSDDPPRERDRVFEFDGVRVFVDPKSLIYLAGTVLDWEQTLMFQGFKFRNPQEATSCGCGHSFTV